VAEELEAAVLRGEYRVGDRLPTEHELAGRHGINRHTAGQALNHLQGKGLVFRVRGRGSFVRPGRIEYRVAEKMSFSDSVARAGLRPSKKVLGTRRVRAYGRPAEALRVAPGEPLVSLERVSYAAEVPLVYSTKFFREGLFPDLYDLMSGPYGSSSWALIKGHYGHEMRRARSTFEIEPADPEMSRLLGVPPGVPLLVVESLDTLEDGTPAEWGIAYFRGDAAKVRVEIREVRED